VPRSTTSSIRRRSPLSALFKLVYFVPEDARDATREAVFAAGGGRIGDYERCSWYTAGTGTSLARAGASPTIGDVGEEQRVPEFRVEIVVPEESLTAAVAALRAAHPYEEVALDVYPLRTP
jgi:hypothetical protein